MVLTVLIARALDVESFGAVFVLISAIMAAGPIGALGYDVVVLREGSKAWSRGRLSRFAAVATEGRLAAALGGFVCFMLFIIWDRRSPGGIEYEASIVVAFAVSCCCSALSTVNRSVLRSADRLGSALFGNSVIRVVAPVVPIALLAHLQELSSSTVMVSYLGGVVLATGWEQRCLRRLQLGQLLRPDRPEWLRVSLGAWVGEVSQVAIERGPALVLGLSGELSVAAVYLAADRVAQLGRFLLDAVRTAVGPMIARAEGGLEASVAHASGLIAMSGAVGSAALALAGPPILGLFGDAYSRGLIVLLILLAGQVSTAVFGPTGLVLSMHGEEKVRSVVSLSMAVGLTVSLLFVDSAVGVAVLVSGYGWVMNFSLWLAIRWRLGVWTGVFALRRVSVSAIARSEMADLVRLAGQVRNVPVSFRR